VTRFLAQSILTGEWLAWELPMTAEITLAENGPTILSGTFEPEITRVADLGLDGHATWIHHEESGLIRASGIMLPGDVDTGAEQLTFDAVGITGYPHGIPYEGAFDLGTPVGVGVDPLDVWRHIWAHVLSHPDAPTGVTLSQVTSPARIGEPERDVSFETAEGQQVDFSAGPYTLDWWSNTDCGREIDELASQTPFGYRERPTWSDASKTAVTQHVEAGYPRIGRRRPDLRMAADENLLAAVPVEEDPQTYVSQVIVLGAGEGSTRVRGYAGNRLGSRVRRVHVVDDKTVTSKARANAVAANELARRQASLLEVTEVVADARHRNAPLGSFLPGDSLFIEAEVPYLGQVSGWHRVTSLTYAPAAETMSLSLQREGTPSA
jgi:hypothetical protein